MRSRLSRLAALALAGSSAAFAVVAVAAPPASATPPFEPNPQSAGTITFYNSTGTAITTGSTNSGAFAAYAVGSASPRSTDRQAQLQFANPRSDQAQTKWFTANASAPQSFPLTSGPTSITGLSAANPAVAVTSADDTLDHFETVEAKPDTATNYANTVEVRLRTANATGQNAPTYDVAVLSIDPTNHTWTETYPTNSVVQQDPGTFVSLPPARLLDTRSTKAVSANSAVQLQVLGKGGVPDSDVSAVVLNVTATASTSGGYVTVWPDGTTRPTASNLNFVKGRSVPNSVIAPVGSDGKIDLFNGSSGTVQLIADVSGYYVGGTPSASGAFQSLAPSRVLDTRSSLGAKTPGANGTIALQVDGQGGVPASGVSAVVLNVTVTGASKGGYVTAWADGTTRPNASNVSFVAGQSQAGLVVAPVGSDGKVDLYNGSGASIQLIGDVSGYYLKGVSTPYLAGTFDSLAPSRLLDTRSTGAVASSGTVQLQVLGKGGVPASNVSAVVLTVTATSAKSSGYVTVWADGSTRPTASNLNFIPGRSVANLVVAPVGSDGKVDLFNGSQGTVQLIADVSGYYLKSTEG